MTAVKHRRRAAADKAAQILKKTADRSAVSGFILSFMSLSSFFYVLVEGFVKVIIFEKHVCAIFIVKEEGQERPEKG